MGDFIKELNIVDFLGMLLPGSFLILLLSMDYPVEMFFISYFGASIDSGLKSIFLIICGYFAGMLVHEIGDIMEKLVQYFVYLNPRFYAAKAVGFDNIKACSKNNYGISQIKIKKRKNNKILRYLPYCSILFWLMILLFSLAVCLFCPTKDYNIFSIFFILGFISIVSLIILSKFSNKNKRIRRDLKIHRTILKINPEIQCFMFDKGTVAKRRVFDGFHVMMRNIIIVVALVQVYVYLVQNSEKQLYRLIVAIHDNSWMRIGFFIIIIIMIIRWFHYIYLQYKYLYEDFIVYVKTDINIVK